MIYPTFYCPLYLICKIFIDVIDEGYLFNLPGRDCIDKIEISETWLFVSDCVIEKVLRRGGSEWLHFGLFAQISLNIRKIRRKSVILIDSTWHG